VEVPIEIENGDICLFGAERERGREEEPGRTGQHKVETWTCHYRSINDSPLATIHLGKNRTIGKGEKTWMCVPLDLGNRH
jgi:hypothetical protein